MEEQILESAIGIPQFRQQRSKCQITTNHIIYKYCESNTRNAKIKMLIIYRNTKKPASWYLFVSAFPIFFVCVSLLIVLHAPSNGAIRAIRHRSHNGIFAVGADDDGPWAGPWGNDDLIQCTLYAFHILNSMRFGCLKYETFVRWLQLIPAQHCDIPLCNSIII